MRNITWCEEKYAKKMKKQNKRNNCAAWDECTQLQLAELIENCLSSLALNQKWGINQLKLGNLQKRTLKNV